MAAATDRSLRWKTLFLVFLVAWSVAYLLPSTRVELPTWYQSAFSNKVQLGLDLQGGLHIVYGVDLDKVVDDKAGEVRRDMEDRLAEMKLAGQVQTPRTPIGSVYVILDKAEDKAKIDDKVLSDYRDVLDKVSCPAEIADRAVCLRVSMDYAEKIQDSAITQAIKTIKDRVDRFGISEATIIRKGFDIIVELPGADKAEIERLKSLIDRTAQLEFKIVAENNPYTSKLVAHVKTDPQAIALGIETDVEVWDNEAKGQFQDAYLTAKDQTRFLTAEEAKKLHCDDEQNLQGEGENKGTYKCKVTGRQIIEEYVAKLPAELQPPENFQLGFEKVEVRRPKGVTVKDEDRTWRSYLLSRAAELTGTAVSQADVTWDQTTGRPEVLVTFNRQGTRRFGDLTSKNVGKKMAIILDEEVASAPTIQTAITGGRCTITMGGGADPKDILRQAQDLVTVLRTGSLPAPLKQESESQVGATLGQDAIDRAEISMAVGAGLVILIMLFFYRGSGVIANFAMVLNLLFQMAVLAMFQATLTLPGIAGLVLTIGMAVDSNIIIYERIREELNAGKTVKGAVDAGFGRAFWTVFDAHVTNFVAGFVLLEYGTGPIRGFAVMLLIGVVCNLFTSTWCSRLFFDHLLARRKTATSLSI